MDDEPKCEVTLYRLKCEGSLRDAAGRDVLACDGMAEEASGTKQNGAKAMDTKTRNERGALIVATTWVNCKALEDAGNLRGAATLSEQICTKWRDAANPQYCPGCGRAVSAPPAVEHRVWCALHPEKLEAQELAELAALWGGLTGTMGVCSRVVQWPRAQGPMMICFERRM